MLSDMTFNGNIVGGRKKALEMLAELANYDEKLRDRLDYPSTILSPYIRFGCVSIREVYYCLHGREVLVRQLWWREFYYQQYAGDAELVRNCLVQDGGKNTKNKGKEYQLANQPMHAKYAGIKWKNDPEQIDAWMSGRTGFPIVDAGMRQLNLTGFMHNRSRLICASFLVKTLLVDWRIGEKYFANKLIDYDPIVNSGNWQWVAGCGADSQPYFRVFNPWSQSLAHDPEAVYIRHWLPELAGVSATDLHRFDEVCSKYKIMINNRLYCPIVDFAKQKVIVMNAYNQALGYKK